MPIHVTPTDFKNQDLDFVTPFVPHLFQGAVRNVL